MATSTARKPSAASAASISKAAKLPKRSATMPARRVLMEAPTPMAHPTAPCARLKWPLRWARSLKNAPILILDEATSALDTEAEEAIRAALERLMTGRTVITIAHRLSTLRRFDRILVLRGGRLVESGPPEELMRRPGVYRDLVSRELGRLSEQVV